MRRLEMCEYMINVSQKTEQILTSSYSVFLERTWHRQSRLDYELSVHAKFNADDMNGIQVAASLTKMGDHKASVVSEIRISRVSDADWSETFIVSVVPTETLPGVFSSEITQVQLGLNELSGKETYAIEVTATRKRRRFISKVYVNHLGCFDSILRLKNEVNYLHSTKLDE